MLFIEPFTSEVPTTVNPFFKRRVSIAKFKRPTSTTPKLEIQTEALFEENPTEFEGIQPSDQGVDSTIQQFTQNRYNQIGESIEDLASALGKISKAPLPVPSSSVSSTTIKYKNHKYETKTHLPIYSSSTQNYQNDFVEIRPKSYYSSTPRVKQYVEEIYIENPKQSRRRHHHQYQEATQTDRQVIVSPATKPRKSHRKVSAFEKIINSNEFTSQSTLRPFPTQNRQHNDYDYYDDENDKIIGKLNSQVLNHTMKRKFY